MKQQTSPTQKALNVWAIVLIIWALYRANFRTDLGIWFDEFIAKPSVFILPIFYYVTRFEKKDFFSAVGIRKITSKSLVYAFIAIVVSVALMFILRRYADLPNTLTIETFITILIISFATSISEQILSTGFVLQRLYDESKNPLTATFFASILFFFVHVPILFTNEKIMGFTLVRVMITDLLLSLSIGFIYLSRKNLLAPILIHTFYNLSIYMLMQ